jgi:DNA excision repair protein ERCC-6
MLMQLEAWLKKARAEFLYQAIDEEDLQTMEPHSFCGTAYAIVTTYENLRRNSDLYSAHDWSYVVLDEAQKIRNPDAEVTLVCKRIRTPHRIAMSGTPIQNDLRELWSLLDFVFPGRLGTLPAFEQEFANPIRRGGYSNASPMQVQLAYRCALTLRDLIEPFLLRRRKREVKEVARMPAKTEHVLFCRLSQRQRLMYEAYLRSDDVQRVLRGTGQLLAAVTMLRKICNHPDLVIDPDEASLDKFLRNGFLPSQAENSDELSDTDPLGGDDEETLMDRSGKLEVLAKILPLWLRQGHRVLIFCQWQRMLNIIQRFLLMKHWKFARLDGNTNVASRQRLVDAFNSDGTYFCMLCTTRTGGVGLNLTGANRVILYDPDFNPQTDAQARERAWRFGQSREVTVYRLITAGTVEEKIYQRQIFKTALTNSVLQDPRQRRLFSQRDLRDLFSLKADAGSLRGGGDGLTETGEATRGVGVVDVDDGPPVDSSKDDEETLRKVMKSKGLAGIFDHSYVEQEPMRKSTTQREMEEQAREAARRAVAVLQQSVATDPAATAQESRFGPSRGSISLSRSAGAAAVSSSLGLLASLRQRQSAVESSGLKAPLQQSADDETSDHARLLLQIQEFVGRRRPSTDEVLERFEDTPGFDLTTFRELLKSVARVENGRWKLLSRRESSFE